MKIKYTLYILVLICCSRVILDAQENNIPKRIPAFDLAIGTGDAIYSGALSFNQTHGFFSSKKFRLGYGLRFSGFTGSDLIYITAPPNLQSNKSTIDTLIVNSPFTMGLSASIHIEYMFMSKLKAGFNIDVFGFGFGSKRATTFASSENKGTFPVNPSAKPTPFNILLIGDRDIGQLRSEFFVAYAISEKFWIRCGIDHTFSEYTTSVKLTNNNDRFRYEGTLFFLGLSFSPFTGTRNP